MMPVNDAGAGGGGGGGDVQFPNARRFDGTDDYLQFSVGSLSAFNTSGAFTLAVLIKLYDTTDGGLIVGRTSANAIVVYSDVYGGAYDVGSDTIRYFPSVSAPATGDNWHVVVITKASGAAVPRIHKRKLGAFSWEHVNGTGNLSTHNTIGASGYWRLGQWETTTGENLNADMAVAGIKMSDTSDAAVEAANLHVRYSGWQGLFTGAGSALWPLHQASTATTVEDATGGGANQTGRVGTAIATPPTGFWL